MSDNFPIKFLNLAKRSREFFHYLNTNAIK